MIRFQHRLVLLLVPLLCLISSWAGAAKSNAFVFRPTTGTGPFPVAVWLHGYRGYSKEGYVRDGDKTLMQKHADTLGAVIIGFPATTNLPDDTQQWSEEPVADHAYIQSWLKEISTTVPLDLKRVGLFGFSQGAMVAADVAACYPQFYRGAILMSPGGIGEPILPGDPEPSHASQVYFCFCGAGEAEGNVRLTKHYAARLEGLGAKVTLKAYEGMTEHTRPPDFAEKFTEWMGAILKK